MATALKRKEKKEMKARLLEIAAELADAMTTLESVSIDLAEATNRLRAANADNDRLGGGRREAELFSATVDYNGAKSRYEEAGAYIKGMLDKYQQIFDSLIPEVGSGEASRLDSERVRMLQDYEARRARVKDIYMSRINVRYSDDTEGDAEHNGDNGNTAHQAQGGENVQTDSEQSRKPDGATDTNGQQPVQNGDGQNGQSSQNMGGVAEQQTTEQGGAEQSAEDGDNEQVGEDGETRQQTEQGRGSDSGEQPSARQVDTSAGITRVNVAPVTIDIAPIVQRAINATVERIEQGLQKRIDDYLAAFDPSRLSSTVGNGNSAGKADSASQEVEQDAETLLATATANTRLSARLLEEEKQIYNSLRDMINSLSGLITELGTLANGCIELSGKQKELAELQRSVNDAQRATLREQQGVQVNQRVIAGDQATINEDQALLAERNKENLEKQKALLADQEGILGLQQSLCESQTSLSDAVKEAAELQRKLLSAQASVMQSSNKSLDGVRALADKQEETAALQKQLMTRQRQLIKDQRTLAERADKKKSE